MMPLSTANWLSAHEFPAVVADVPHELAPCIPQARIRGPQNDRIRGCAKNQGTCSKIRGGMPSASAVSLQKLSSFSMLLSGSSALGSGCTVLLRGAKRTALSCSSPTRLFKF